jgi:hypothetical protein
MPSVGRQGRGRKKPERIPPWPRAPPTPRRASLYDWEPSRRRRAPRQHVPAPSGAACCPLGPERHRVGCVTRQSLRDHRDRSPGPSSQYGLLLLGRRGGVLVWCRGAVCAGGVPAAPGLAQRGSLGVGGAAGCLVARATAWGGCHAVRCPGGRQPHYPLMGTVSARGWARQGEVGVGQAVEEPFAVSSPRNRVRRACSSRRAVSVVAECGPVGYQGHTLYQSRAQQGCAADAQKRPLRSRFWARLTPGVRPQPSNPGQMQERA